MTSTSDQEPLEAIKKQYAVPEVSFHGERSVIVIARAA